MKSLSPLKGKSEWAAFCFSSQSGGGNVKDWQQRLLYLEEKGPGSSFLEILRWDLEKRGKGKPNLSRRIHLSEFSLHTLHPTVLTSLATPHKALLFASLASEPTEKPASISNIRCIVKGRKQVVELTSWPRTKKNIPVVQVEPWNICQEDPCGHDG